MVATLRKQVLLTVHGGGRGSSLMGGATRERRIK